MWNGFWDMIKFVSKSCPSWKSGKSCQNRNFFISTFNYQRYTKFTTRYMFLWTTNAMKLVKVSLRITKDVKIQDGCQLWLKISISVLGKRQETQIMTFNSHPYTLSLQCRSYRKFSQLSQESGAGNALHGFEISMFWFFLNFILYTYPKIYCCCRHKML